MDPSAECPTCLLAERTPREQVRAAVHLLVRGRPDDRLAAARSADYSARLVAIVNGRRHCWYEEHRARWVHGGDLAELHRMLRHVTMTTPPDPPPATTRGPRRGVRRGPLRSRPG